MPLFDGQVHRDTHMGELCDRVCVHQTLDVRRGPPGVANELLGGSADLLDLPPKGLATLVDLAPQDLRVLGQLDQPVGLLVLTHRVEI